MEVPDEAVQRFMAEDVDRVAVVLAPGRLHVDGALIAAQPRTGVPRPNQRLAEGLVAGLGRILGEDPCDRADDCSLGRHRLDRLGGRTASGNETDHGQKDAHGGQCRARRLRPQARACRVRWPGRICVSRTTSPAYFFPAYCLGPLRSLRTWAM